MSNQAALPRAMKKMLAHLLAFDRDADRLAGSVGAMHDDLARRVSPTD